MKLITFCFVWSGQIRRWNLVQKRENMYKRKKKGEQNEETYDVSENKVEMKAVECRQGESITVKH